MTTKAITKTTTCIPFKKEKNVEERKQEYNRISNKYPDLIPVICERMNGSTIPESQRRKYLVPSDITMGQFKYVIRKRINLLPDQALFVFINQSVLAPTNSLVKDVHKEHADEDGFLYMVYSGESTFG
jgi:GABA(A) receptor-associated protein